MPGLYKVQNIPYYLLNMPEYVWICPNIRELVGIFMNMPKLPEWLLFDICQFPHLF